jgi:PIN domain nuclease of toxin-antitoxin system
MKYLLDTHTLVWWVSGTGSPSRAQRRAFASASERAPLGLSDISLWEIAALHERRKLRLSMPLREWLSRATAIPLVRRLELSPEVVSEMCALPATRDWDPADRLIVATARVHGLRLVTADARIVDSDLVATVA